MSRPIYESKQDLDREKQLSTILSEAWSCSFVKMPIKYHLDYAMLRDEKIVGFCEMKSPNYSLADFRRFGGFFISLDKFMSSNKLNGTTMLPCFIVLNALDGVWYASFHDAKLTAIKMKGRKDRNDWQDMEPCVVLDTDQFKLLGEKL
jgi:hypothetical protein